MRNLTLLLAATSVVVGLTAGPHAEAATPGRSVFGVNMSLYGNTDQLKDDPATQRLLRSWHVPFVRVPMRPSLSDAVLTDALRAVRAVGAIPVVILNGPGQVADDAAVLTRDLHDLDLVEQVFREHPVYLEYGNEDDLDGVTAQRYTASWNAVIGAIKAKAPQRYEFVGPANYQSNPGYVGTFVAGAHPRPDFVSWHEYVCTAANTSTCTSHLANWAKHATAVNAAERSAIGGTIPFLITEWNVDPANSPADEALYADPAFIQPWTAAAIDELRSLIPLGLAGAMIYTASDHDDFALVKPGPTPTPQGETFKRAAGCR